MPPRPSRSRLRRLVRGAVLVLAGLLGLGALAFRLAPRFAGGPLGPIPGGRLAGPEAACPDPRAGGFDFARGVREVQVEVRPEAPRSVTTWALVEDGVLHVPADWLTPWKTWPHLVVEDPRVRVRVRGTVYDCCATRVEDPAAIERLRRATSAKYDVDPESRAAQVQVWWFRIAPCEGAPAGGGRGAAVGA